MNKRHAFVIGILVLGAVAIGCGDSPVAPAGPPLPVSLPPAAAPSVSSVIPKTGRTDRTTQIFLLGSAFGDGATVTVGDERVATTFVAADQLRVLAPPHAPGPVDVVVTNVDGQSFRVVAAFTYLPLPPLALRYVSPDTGSTSGGTTLFVSGDSLLSGAIVTVDGVAVQAGVNIGGALFTTDPHSPGSVQIVVTNPDGAVSNALTYTFAPPESFDFNGTWESYSDDIQEEPNFVFTIQNNQLTSVTCRGGVPITFATPPVVSGGAFGFTLADGSRMAGQIVARDSTRGDMNLTACGPPNWVAFKRQ